MKTSPPPPLWHAGNEAALRRIRLLSYWAYSALAVAAGMAGVIGYAVSGGRMVSTSDVVAVILAVVFLVGFIAAGIWGLANVRYLLKPWRRIEAMWTGRVGFEHATKTDVHRLSHVGGVVWHSADNPVGLNWSDSHKMVAAWQGEATPRLQPATVVRWLLTGEDVHLLVVATQRGFDDADLLGYLTGGVEERAAFEFLMALTSTT